LPRDTLSVFRRSNDRLGRQAPSVLAVAMPLFLATNEGPSWVGACSIRYLLFQILH
jgi:hypothetical protein